MQHKLSTDVQRYANRRRRNTRHRLLGCIAGILVFCITYAALLPAISQAAPYISEAVKTLMAPTYEYDPSDKYTSYTYSDNDIDVVVQLPADSNVPKDAILRVTPIKETHAQYASLASKAEKAVNGAVKQAQFYDISFYTERMEYIPVDDRAKVSINYSAPTMDVDSDIVVLHYDENDDNPITLDKTDFTEEPYTSEQELTFETDGFSVFAVVELTSMYQTVEGIAGLEGKSYIIAGVNNGNGENTDGTPNELPVMTSVPANNTRLQKRQTKSFVYSDNKVTSVALTDYTNAVWTFEKAGTGTYYIKNSQGQYLSIPAKDQLTLSGEKQEFRVVAATGATAAGDVTNAVCIQAVDNSLYVDLAANDVNNNFTSWDETTGNPGHHLVLVKYIEPETIDLSNLVGKNYIIVGVNNNLNNNSGVTKTNLPVLTGDNGKYTFDNGNGRTVDVLNANKRTTEGAVYVSNHVMAVALADTTKAVWTFEKAEGYDNAYYIKNTSTNTYLYFNGENLTLSDQPQAIEALKAGGFDASAGDDQNAIYLRTVDEPHYYVNLVGNGNYTCFFGYNPGGNDDRGNHLALIEYKEQVVTSVVSDAVVNNLDGKNLIITNRANNVALTGSALNTDNDNENTNDNRLKAARVTVADDQSTVTVSSSDANLVWEFRAAGTPGQYYIKHVATGKYLHIYDKAQDGSKPLTLEDTPQAIEVLSAKDNNNPNAVWIRCPISNLYQGGGDGGNPEDYNCIDLFGGNANNGFCVWNKSPGEGLSDSNKFLLSEYTDLPVMDAVDPTVAENNLDGKKMVITAANYNVAMSNNATTIGGRGMLEAQETTEKNGILGVVADPELTDVSWTFVSAGGTNQYYIKDSNGKYLNIDKTDVSLTDEIGRKPISVYDKGNGTFVLCATDDTTGDEYLLEFNASSNAFSAVGRAHTDSLNDTRTNQIKLTPVEQFEQEVKVVTNLAGKVGILCAVDTPADWAYSAIVTDNPTDGNAFGDGRVGLQTVQTDGEMVYPNDTKQPYNTVNLDDYANKIWKIIGADKPGQYYIQSLTTGKYLHLDATGATLTDEPQALEIVRAATIYWPNAFCVRASVGGTNYYLNLHGNTYTNPVSAWSFDGIDTPGDRSNNFVFAELSEEEMAVIEPVAKAIDALPTQEALVNSVRDLLKQDGATIPDQAQALQTNTIAAASDAIEAYDALSPEQKIFLGIDRINKIEELKEWLISDDEANGRLPNEVPAVPASGVTVKLFNYNNNVTNEKFYTDGFKFFNQNGNSVDGYGDKKDYVDKVMVQHPSVTFKLNDQGYPVLVDVVDGVQKEIDLSNLFNGKNYQVATMTDGGGLFRQDENGYYFYYSDMNAAYYDQSQGKFILYDTIVRPGNTSWNNDNLDWNPSGTYESDRRSNFLPFNALINPDGTSSIIYDSEYHQENNVQDIAGLHDLKLIGEQTPVPTAVINDRTDLWFGMNIEFNFLMPEDGKLNGEDMMFDFHGDDDVWVFIDDVPVLNLVGTHAAWDGSINFATGEVRNQYEDAEGKEGKALYKETTLKKLFLEAAGVTDESVTSVTINGKTIAFNGDTLADFTTHNLKFFYLERGGFISYSGIKFNMPVLPEKSLTVSKAVTSENGEKINDQTYYTFRILQADDDNNDKKLDPFFAEGMQFEVWENSGPTGEFGYIDPKTGIFSIKAGQTAVFYNILAFAADSSEHELVVQEIIYNEKTGQYESVNINGQPATEENEYNFDHEDDKVYTSSRVDGADGGNVAFTNVIKPPTSTLQITKEATEGAVFGEREFQFVVLLGDERIVGAENATMVNLTRLPVGTTYTVTDKNGNEIDKTVETAGIITLKVGETATINGLVLGTNYEVSEVIIEDGGYMVDHYDVSGGGSINITASSASGEITDKEQTVTVTVTNAPYDFAMNVRINKQVIGYNNPDTFTFNIEQVVSKDGAWTVVKDFPNANITLSNGETAMGTAVLGFKKSESGTYYFRITELNTNGNYIYDTTEYLATVEVNGESKTATMTNLQKIVYNSDGSYKELVDVARDQNSGEFPITFVNYGTYATVTKKVTAGETGGEFRFEAMVVYDSSIIFTWPKNDSYYICGDTLKTEDGKKYNIITFTLQDGESVSFPIPTDSTVTVTEKNPEGYITSYQVTQTSSGGIGAITNGTVAEATVTTGPLTINFFNQGGYKLPETGGAGTQLYTFGGLLLMAVPLMYGYKRKRAWKGGELA